MKKTAQIHYQENLWKKLVVYLFIGVFVYSFIPNVAHAALGNTRTINFQGRVVNKSDGTNVADNTYSFIFKLYDAASGGNLLWQETQSSVQVTSGIFQVQLGSVTAFNAGGYNVNFNTSPLYLDITYAGETFGTRVQMATVPYALNAETLDGVIATSSAIGFTLTGGQSTPKTLTINNSIGLTGTDGTTFTFPSTSTTIAGLGIAQTFTNAQTITPTQNSAVALTVNSTSSTAADAADINLVNASGTATNGLLVNLTGAGTVTNGIQVQNSSGTLTNGITFTGTFTKLINSTNFNVGNGGIITLVGNNTADIITTGTNTLKLDTAGAAGITIGGTNANAITLGNIGHNTTLTLLGTGLTTLGGNLTVNGTTENVGNGSSYTIQTSTNAGLALLSAGTGNISLGQNSGVGNITIQPNAGGQAALIVNKQSATGDVFTASASGQTLFRITNNGAFLFQDSILVASGSGSSGNGSSASENALGDEGSLIPNAGFESALVSPWGDGWFPAATSSAGLFTRDTSTPAKGTSSLSVTISNTTAAIYSACIPVAGATGLGAYTLNYYAKSSSSTKMNITSFIDGYTSKANCQSDTTPTLAVVKSAIIGTSWVLSGSGASAIGSFGASATWARVHFLFNSTSSGIVGEVDGVRFVEKDGGQGLDYAENYPTDSQNSAQAGDIVAMEPGGVLATVVPATNKMDAAIGVVSTNPGYVLDDGFVPNPKVPVALSGRVPVHVSTENGPIQMGDSLTASSIPGVAVKATKAGPIIGQAMEDYTGPGSGTITAFLKVGYFTGESLASLPGLALSQNASETTNETGILSALLVNANENIVNPAPASEIFTDRVAATLGIVTPTLTVNTIYAHKIHADEIDGLQIFTNQLSALQNQVASQSLVATESAIVEPPTIATSSGDLTLSSISISGLATISADLRVQHNALIEGILSVADTIMANNFIVNGISDFFGNVIFHGAVAFQQVPTFTQDTAGYAVIHKGVDYVDVKFGSVYPATPVINATLFATPSSELTPSVGPLQALQTTIAANGYSYIITRVSTQGFTILLSKTAADDVTFSWSALMVSNPNTQASDNQQVAGASDISTAPLASSSGQ